jgi:hypothetical protein
MTNTVFQMFQTQYILDFSSASRSETHWDLPNMEIFQSKDVPSVQAQTEIFYKLTGWKASFSTTVK